MVEKENIKYWDNIEVGDIIQLTDEQTIEYLLNEGIKGITHGADFEVIRIKYFKETNMDTNFKIFYIQKETVLWYLIIRYLKTGAIDTIGIYFMPDDLDVWYRREFIEQGHDWLFDEPEDVNNYSPKDLYFVGKIVQDDGITFRQESRYYGSSFEYGQSVDFATIVEYTTTQECDNPKILILELAAMTEDEEEVVVNLQDSLVFFLQGNEVSSQDITALK
jgi:hypothetical protein